MGEVTSSPSTKSAWIWAIICGLYAISPVDIIPDVIPIAGWADDALAVVGGGLNLIQATVAQTNSTLASLIKYVKWGVILLGGILVLILAFLGAAIFSFFK